MCIRDRYRYVLTAMWPAVGATDFPSTCTKFQLPYFIFDGVLTGVEETPTDGGGGARAMLSRVAQLVRQTPGVERVGVSPAGEDVYKRQQGH